VAIGDQILDLAAVAREGLLDTLPREMLAACQSHTLNALMSLGRPALTALRARISLWLREGDAAPGSTPAPACWCHRPTP
jgi:fumarylacetoacetase